MRRANGLNEFYSIYREKSEKIELFVDKNGSPTIDYPHVHVVHHGDGNVDVVASRSASDHPWRTTLRNPSAGDVESAARQARSRL